MHRNTLPTGNGRAEEVHKQHPRVSRSRPGAIDSQTPASENVARGWLGEPALASQARAEALRHHGPHRKTDRRAGPRIAVAHGYGLKVRVEHRHLVVEDGFGRQRRTRRFHRTSKLRRLVIIGRSGYITLDALSWLHDTGAALLHVDTNGDLIAATVRSGPDFAALRRAQALAAAGPAGLEIACHTLTLKVEGQRALLAKLPGGPDAAEQLDWYMHRIRGADDVAWLLSYEAGAAESYWHAWAQVPVKLGPPSRAARQPGHWLTFGARASLLTGGPRSATNPANAILNYLYSLLEAETILGCHACGLDPGIGIFHADRRDRASLALDLMEAARPAVDAYLLALLTRRTLSARDFVETRDGACRLAPRLAAELAGTCDTWRQHIAPVVELVAHTLARQSPARVPTPTPLTRSNTKRARDRRSPNRPNHRSQPRPAALPSTCRECGRLLSDGRRQYCEECRKRRFEPQPNQASQKRFEVLAQRRAEGTDPAHEGRAAAFRGAKIAAHHAAARGWAGERPDPSVFTDEILPALQRVPVSKLRAATGLSNSYCLMIKRAKRIPHPRTWDAFRRVSRQAASVGD